jgi:hypothetical protein
MFRLSDMTDLHPSDPREIVGYQVVCTGNDQLSFDWLDGQGD